MVFVVFLIEVLGLSILSASLTFLRYHLFQRGMLLAFIKERLHTDYKNRVTISEMKKHTDPAKAMQRIEQKIKRREFALKPLFLCYKCMTSVDVTITLACYVLQFGTFELLLMYVYPFTFIINFFVNDYLQSTRIGN